MATIKSEFSCPTCKRKTGALVQIMASEGSLQCSNGHSWNDTASFYNESPTVDFKVTMPGNLPQEGHTPLTISIPIALEQHLRSTYGAKLNATLASVMAQLSDNAMMIAETDLDRLRNHLGKMPANSSELVGLIYAKACEAQEANSERDNANRELKAYEGISPGTVVINLGDQYTAAQELARNAELPLKVWAEQRLTGAIRDNWF